MKEILKFKQKIKNLSKKRGIKPLFCYGRSDGIQNLYTKLRAILVVDSNGTVRYRHKKAEASSLCFFMVGVTGFEPTTSWSRTKRTTKLCHTPRNKIVQNNRALTVVTKVQASSRATRFHQVTATPYCSLHPPPAAVANVPNCATPRKQY